MIRPRSLFAACLTVAGLGLVSCGQDTTLAGKTTTTSNGGDLVALGPDGSPLARGVVLAARTWNPSSGTPGQVDTFRTDAQGRIFLESGMYAVVELRDAAGVLGASRRRWQVTQGELRSVVLDTVRRLAGRWADHTPGQRARLFLDSSLQAKVGLSDDGSFLLEQVLPGSHRLRLESDSGRIREMGVVQVNSSHPRYTGSGNLLFTGDTTGSPLWIDDFESGSGWPLLRASLPGVSPWFMWWMEAEMTLPGSTEPDSIKYAILPDPVRGGKSFQARIHSTGSNAWIAAGITNMELDLRARSLVCLSYRTESPLRIEFQRDSVADVRPTLYSVLPAAPAWRDTCARIGDFLPDSQTPDSLATWPVFGRRVLVLQFSASSGATRLDLDDIRLR